MGLKPGQMLFFVHVIILMIVVVPVFFFRELLDQLAVELMSGQHATEIALMTVGLLTADIFVPIPSSAVSVSAGMYLGVPLGFAACFVGLTIGCWLGYGFGYYFRRLHFDRFYSDYEFQSLSKQLSRYGYIVLLACRGIPLLAEMSVMVAGFHRYPLLNFTLVTSLGNAILAGLFSYVGDSATNVASVYLLIATFLLIPAVTYSIRLWWLQRIKPSEDGEGV